MKKNVCFRALSSAAMAAVLMHSAPAFADGEGDNEDAETEIAKKTEELLERTKLIEQQAALLKALGVPETTGETKLEESAGSLESEMIAMWAVADAAGKIVTSLGTSADGRTVIVASGSGVVRLSDYTVFKQRADRVFAASTQLHSRLCRGLPTDEIDINKIVSEGITGTSDDDPAVAGFTGGALPAIGAALTLLRSDTTISGFTAEGMDASLAMAIAGQLPDGRVMGQVSAITSDNPALSDMLAIMVANARLRALLPSGDKPGSCSSIEDSARPLSDAEKSALVATIAASEAFLIEATKQPEDGGLSPFENAANAATYFTADASPLVLRLAVREAGGSIIKRSNLWTALGAPAVGLTGGVTGHYALIDPANSKVVQAGIFVCKTDKTSFGDVHKRGVEAACSVAKYQAERNQSVIVETK